MATKKGNTKKKNSTNKGVKKTNNTKKKVVKNEKEKIENVNESFGVDIWNKLIVVCIIIIFLCLFYLLTVHITNKHSSDSDDSSNQTTSKSTSSQKTSKDDSTAISYDETIVGRSFSVDSGEYIIVYYDMSDEDIKSQFSSLVSGYKSKEDHLNIYSVNMGDGLNKPYAKDESNSNPSKASEIAINGPTLIKFSDGSVEDYVEGYDDISSYLE